VSIRINEWKVVATVVAVAISAKDEECQRAGRGFDLGYGNTGPGGRASRPRGSCRGRIMRDGLARRPSRGGVPRGAHTFRPTIGADVHEKGVSTGIRLEFEEYGTARRKASFSPPRYGSGCMAFVRNCNNF
jgi:hypothetical protein